MKLAKRCLVLDPYERTAAGGIVSVLLSSFSGDAMKGLSKKMDELRQAKHAGLIVAELTDGLEKVVLELEEVEKVACSVRGVTLRNPALPKLSDSARQALAERICSRLTYLEHPLVVHEHDRGRKNVELRSAGPEVDDQTRRYFEMTVGPEITFRRYEKRPSESRVAVSADLTFRVLERFLDDVRSEVADTASKM